MDLLYDSNTNSSPFFLSPTNLQKGNYHCESGYASELWCLFFVKMSDLLSNYLFYKMSDGCIYNSKITMNRHLFSKYVHELFYPI